MAARPSRPDSVNEYEQKRLDRIAANQAKLGSIGVLQQKSLLEASFRSVKRPATPKPAKGTTPATRHSQRLQQASPGNAGLQEFPDEGRAMVSRPRAAGESTEVLYSTEKRCRQKGRGSLYDNVAGITCHFCRQKKLCGEEDCRRCSERDVEQDCIGKSECSRCSSACGRFCRACLLIRYGQQLEAVREQMEKGTWLCPHCYEEDHPDENWICNSSICMTRRGLKPTGIAIFEAQQQGFASVAHHLQAQLASRRRGYKAGVMANLTSDAAPSRAVCEETEQVADAAGGSSFREEALAKDSYAAILQSRGCTSQPAECGVQTSPANHEIHCEQRQKQSCLKTPGGRAKAEGFIVHNTSDSSTMDAMAPDAESVQSGTSGTGTNTDSSTATGTVLQGRIESAQGNALSAIAHADEGRQLPRKGSCIVDRGLNTVDIKSSKQTGLNMKHTTGEGTHVRNTPKTKSAGQNSIMGYAVSLRRSGRHV